MANAPLPFVGPFSSPGMPGYDLGVFRQMYRDAGLFYALSVDVGVTFERHPAFDIIMNALFLRPVVSRSSPVVVPSKPFTTADSRPYNRGSQSPKKFNHDSLDGMF